MARLAKVACKFGVWSLLLWFLTTTGITSLTALTRISKQRRLTLWRAEAIAAEDLELEPIAYLSENLRKAAGAPSAPRAAVFSPYHITPGGGERYLLSVVNVLQHMGYWVDLITNEENICRNESAVLDVSNKLRVDVLGDRLGYIRLRRYHTSITKLDWKYEIFFNLGNEKTPQVPGIGQYNLFMCQFPFDLDRYNDGDEQKLWATYQSVLLNSAFSLYWYAQYIQPVVRKARAYGYPFPTVQVLHPPVDPILSSSAPVKQPNARPGIVLLGRIFQGRQSKGHDLAIDIFHEVEKVLVSIHKKQKIKLVLIGHPMPGGEMYLKKLQEMAEGHEIEVVPSATRQVIEQKLSTARVFWQLTGLKVDEEQDPASIEHFGISTVEVMSAGVIPVGLARGGTACIVEHGVSGYLASSEEDFVKYTVDLFTASNKKLLEMQKAAREAAKVFSFGRFRDSFQTISVRGKLSAPFRDYVLEHAEAARKVPLMLPIVSQKVAVIVEHSIRMEFEYVVRTTMRHLGPDWSLCVVHLKRNAAYVQHVLRDIRNVRFISIDFELDDVRGYSRLLKTPRFWKLLQAETALVFQSDSVLLGKDISTFMEYDYVGAPWHRENEIWTSSHAEALRGADGVGNGGLSLRRVDAMISITEMYGLESPDEEPEDVFFVKALLREGFSIAPREVAYRFAREMPCGDLPDEAPFGLHAAWYYDKTVIDRFMSDK